MHPMNWLQILFGFLPCWSMHSVHCHHNIIFYLFFKYMSSYMYVPGGTMHHHLKGSYWQSEDSAHTDTLHYLVTFSSEDTVYVRGSLAASSVSARSKHRQAGKSFKWGMIAYLLKKITTSLAYLYYIAKKYSLICLHQHMNLSCIPILIQRI